MPDAILCRPEEVGLVIRPAVAGPLPDIEYLACADDLSACARLAGQLQQRLAGSVWSQCRSWYRMDGNGRVVALFPGFTREYVRGLKRVEPADYEFA